MMHRFAQPDSGYVGHDPAGLRALLAYLRKAGVVLESVDAMVQRSLRGGSGALPGAPPAVAFTVDDGYADVASLAQPVFAEFDCPFTVFVVPDVVDGKRHYWWDQLAFMMRHSCTQTWVVPTPAGDITAQWTNAESAFATRKRLEAQLKRLPAAQIDAVLRECARQADVPLFSDCPQEYRTLSWREMAGLERRGVQFGAHGMTHTALSVCADEEAAWEISASLERVRCELRNPSSVFCYPFGMRPDVTERDKRFTSSRGGLGAITSEHGSSVIPTGEEAIGAWRWCIPRMAYDERPGTMLRAFFD